MRRRFAGTGNAALVESVRARRLPYTSTDIRRNSELKAIADWFVRTYEGTDGFMLDLRRQLLDGASRALTDYQLTAALNHLRKGPKGQKSTGSGP